MRIRSVFLTNTLTGKKEELRPKQEGTVRFYSCGPTVYSYIHIGNLRGALVADLIYRYLTKIGYKVEYLRNYTDIDDKIIKKSQEEKLTPEALAKKYIEEVEKDFLVAGLLEPTFKARVTDFIPQIIQMISRLIENQKAYLTASGEVFFSIEKHSHYGELSHKKQEDLIVGSRVQANSSKKNPLDFTLWKPAKSAEPAWESPWSLGRPGWHIECSAMAFECLGPQIDLHHGGEDLIFPHHENEIAQSEGASQCRPFVRHWIHHAFLTISEEKMSKSLGNVLTARECLSQMGGELTRLFLLSSHYRSPIDLNAALIEQTLSQFERIYAAKHSAEELVAQKTLRSHSDLRAEASWGEFLASSEQACKKMDAAFANDLNCPAALAALFSLIRDWNRSLQVPLAVATTSAPLAAAEFLRVLREDFGLVLGITYLSTQQAEEQVLKARRWLLESWEGPSSLSSPASTSLSNSLQWSEAQILAQIKVREEARLKRDFQKADEIRKTLESAGILLKDLPQGRTSWKRISGSAF